MLQNYNNYTAEQVIKKFKSTVRVKDFVSGFYCRIIHFVV